MAFTSPWKATMTVRGDADALTRCIYRSSARLSRQQFLLGGTYFLQSINITRAQSLLVLLVFFLIDRRSPEASSRDSLMEYGKRSLRHSFQLSTRKECMYVPPEASSRFIKRGYSSL